ncbi:hypothetical protein CN213_16095 [Sinorhizobium meliloti]|uniref:hypothetical protein n=1 Tax=Rhizobium meliloti TaxID=382 RepID=UPI000FDC076E|nr:hypothetical protein [Sinorhizobium meliloti]RVH56267.1 hypothetical protein CN213_16095 [Sinorhizobium meliloti]
MSGGPYLNAWAVLDIDGEDFHSVHLLKEDAEKFAFGLGSVVELTMAATDAIAAERERCARIVEGGLGRTNTHIARAIREGGDA